MRWTLDMRSGVASPPTDEAPFRCREPRRVRGRRRSGRGAVCVAGLLLSWVAPAAAQTTLAWKLRPGDAFRVEHRTVHAMTLETKNKPFAQKGTMILETRWQVREVKDGVARVTVTVEAMTSKSSTGDAKAEVASKDDVLWQGAVFEIGIDARGRLSELRGYDDLLNKLAAGNITRLKILRALKPPEAFQTLLQDALGPLPDKAAAQGDRWTHQANDVMNLFGTFEHTTEYVYTGPKERTHRVDTKTKTTFKNPRFAVENDVFRVLKGEVKADEATGHFLFDVSAGRMVSVERLGKLRGELTLETLGMAQAVQFESEHRLTIRVRD